MKVEVKMERIVTTNIFYSKEKYNILERIDKWEIMWNALLADY